MTNIWLSYVNGPELYFSIASDVDTRAGLELSVMTIESILTIIYAQTQGTIATHIT